MLTRIFSFITSFVERCYAIFYCQSNVLRGNVKRRGGLVVRLRILRVLVQIPSGTRVVNLQKAASESTRLSEMSILAIQLVEK